MAGDSSRLHLTVVSHWAAPLAAAERCENQTADAHYNPRCESVILSRGVALHSPRTETEAEGPSFASEGLPAKGEERH